MESRQEASHLSVKCVEETDLDVFVKQGFVPWFKCDGWSLTLQEIAKIAKIAVIAKIEGQILTADDTDTTDTTGLWLIRRLPK